MRNKVSIKRSCWNCKFQCDGKKSNAVCKKHRYSDGFKNFNSKTK